MLARPPNSWDRATTFHNIIRKIEPDAVQGSNWDPNSIMHYPFEPGLIAAPEQYRNGLEPEGGLSARDMTWVRTFYPPLTPNDYRDLRAFESVTLNIGPGGQSNFVIRPAATRKYDIGTFGASDTVIVLFEEQRSQGDYAPLRKLGLTERETEVLYWISQGKSNPEIGMIIGASAGTVKKHAQSIFAKLGVEGRSNALLLALDVLRAK